MRAQLVAGAQVVMLTTVDNWRTRYFSRQSRPPRQTVLRWLREGKLPARKVGGRWYIDEAAWLANGDPLVESVLQG